MKSADSPLSNSQLQSEPKRFPDLIQKVCRHAPAATLEIHPLERGEALLTVCLEESDKHVEVA